MRSTSLIALVVAAAAVTGGYSAQAADLGGNCCADLEERVAELEATTARKGNRKVSLQVYGQVSEAIIWWNDGAESNVYVQENNNIQNRLGFQGSAKITSDWSAGYKLELQIRAYRSSVANQLSLGATNNLQIAAYNTVAVTIREAHWYLQSNTYGRISVGRSGSATLGTASINLVNPDGFSGANGPGFASGGYFLRRAGTTGNGGLSALSWQNFAWIRNGDGPHPLDFATTSSQVKYTSPFFLGHTKSSGFQFSADWGQDDAWGVALRYAEEFGGVRVAMGAGYSNWTTVDRGICSTGASGNSATPGANLALPALGSSISCEGMQFSGSMLHVASGLYLSGGGGIINDDNAGQALLARASGNQGAGDGEHSFWWIQGGWQAKLNPLGNTIFWGQYQEAKTGLGTANSIVQVVASNDVLNSLGEAAVIRGTDTSAWGLGISQRVDAAAMTLYMGFYNVQTEGTLGAIATTARAKTNPIDDMQVFYTGATIRF